MTLKLSKVRGKADEYRLVYESHGKSVSWPIDGNDVDLDTLDDVIRTVDPGHPYHYSYPTQGQEGFVPGTNGDYFQPPLFDLPRQPAGSDNLGAQAADKAAREEEMRLRNMGSALGKGINLGPEDIPVFNGEAGDDLPEVNWGV